MLRNCPQYSTQQGNDLKDVQETGHLPRLEEERADELICSTIGCSPSWFAGLRRVTLI